MKIKVAAIALLLMALAPVGRYGSKINRDTETRMPAMFLASDWAAGPACVPPDKCTPQIPTIPGAVLAADNRIR